MLSYFSVCGLLAMSLIGISSFFLRKKRRVLWGMTAVFFLLGVAVLVDVMSGDKPLSFKMWKIVLGCEEKVVFHDGEYGSCTYDGDPLKGKFTFVLDNERVDAIYYGTRVEDGDALHVTISQKPTEQAPESAAACELPWCMAPEEKLQASFSKRVAGVAPPPVPRGFIIPLDLPDVPEMSLYVNGQLAIDKHKKMQPLYAINHFSRK